MVLRACLLAVLAAGCGQSLFDNHTGDSPDGGGGGGGDGMVASSCPATCIGDAAADFPASGSKWRYLDDTRNRMWAPMTAQGTKYTGASGSSIRPCESGVAACSALPGALLVSTSGATSSADPALEYTVASNGVVQLSVRVHVPSGASQHAVRLYRNSREDVLFTANATAGTTFERAITIDALAGDRLLLAIAPMGLGAADIGVHLYVNDTGQVFPSQCQLAVSFASATGNTVGNACGAVVTYRQWDTTTSTSTEVAPQLAAGPFPEQGMAADIPLPRYYVAADVLPHTGDTTTQLWIRHDAFDPSYAGTAYSDLDLDTYGGLQLALFDKSGTKTLEASTCTGVTGSTLDCVFTQAPWPASGGWHFVRVVHTAGQVRMCLDGVRVGSYALAAGKLATTYAPRFGRNVVWTPTGAFFDGAVDDVRTFSTALPCE